MFNIQIGLISNMPSPWLSPIGDIAAAIASFVAVIYAMRIGWKAGMEKSTEFHTYVRKVDKIRKCDHPIDELGYWLVIANATNKPILKWRVTLIIDDSTENIQIKDEEYGPIPPSGTSPTYIKLETQAQYDSAEEGPDKIEVSDWQFKVGKHWMSRKNDGTIKRVRDLKSPVNTTDLSH